MSSRDSDLERKVQTAQVPSAAPGPPPLQPFGLILHHDGRWSHEGQPILNRKLRERFDRSVVYLPEEAKYVVRIGHFRGQIELEEAGFFVRSVDLASGEIALSDGSREPLRVETLSPSPLDGAWLCRVKAGLAPGGLPARFSHSSQAELLSAAEQDGEGFRLAMGSGRVALPDALVASARGGD